MLESMRNHAQSWVAKVLLGGIVLSFALWGVGDYFLGNQIQSVAEVDGEPISDAEFAQAYERQLNSYRQMLGGRFSKEMAEQLGVKDSTLQTLINRRLMLDEAHALGIVAPEAVLVASIRDNPAFQSGGAFDAERYRLLTRNIGFRSTTDFEAEQRLNLIVDGLEQGLLRGASVSDAAVRRAFERQNESRVLDALLLSPAKFAAQVKLSDEQVKSYFDAHPDHFRSPLTIKLQMVEIDAAAIATGLSVGDSELQAAYEQQASRFATPEKRRASHILARVADSANPLQKSAARKKIEQAEARLKAGEPFAKVAKELSDDVTAAKGGDLGLFARGTMVPQFEDVAFSLQPGETSGIIETQFGFHIIRLQEVQPGALKPLASVRDELKGAVLINKATEEAAQLAHQLDDALGREGALAAAASSLNLKVQESGPLGENDALKPPVLAASQELFAKAFALKPGDPVEVSDLGSGRFVALEVVERNEPAMLAFDSVKAKARAEAEQDEAVRLAEKRADELLAAGGTIDAMAKAAGIAKVSSKPVRLSGGGDSQRWMAPELLEAAFSSAEGKVVGKRFRSAEGMVLVAVRQIMPAPEAEFAAKSSSIRAELLKAQQQSRFARWMASVRERHSIEINRKVLDRF